MRRSLCLLTVYAVICAHGASAQVRPQGTARSMKDTLPANVVQRAIDAYTRHDLKAAYAEYDSVFTHEYLNDPAGPHRMRRDDFLQRQLKADTLGWRLLRTRREVFGPF